MAKVSLNGLTQMLGMQFPEAGQKKAAVVAASDGFLVAHSSPKEVFRRDAKLDEKILDIIRSQVVQKRSGRIADSEGREFFGASAEVKDLEWIVYVQQDLVDLLGDISQMRDKIFLALGGVVVLTIIVSFFVAAQITEPLRVLRDAADRLGKGQFESLPDMPRTGDEIEDLGLTIIEMSDSLREKQGALEHKEGELEKANRFLEQRVSARTRELKATQDQLVAKERLAAMGQMASVVGHEIRNPLAVINNSIYFIKTKLSAGAELDPKISKHIKIIESEIQQANGIISEILDFARTRDPKPERLSLNAFIEDILGAYPIPAHIKIDKIFDPAQPWVSIDPTEMRQAVRNLIGNGIEVMPTAGTVRLRTGIDGDKAVLEIADSGPGIPAEVRHRLFTPFFTTKARGTGLGLAVVKKSMERAGGWVDLLDTPPGQGTVFRLYLPLVQVGGPPRAQV